jgi:hypothetical protein
MVHVPKCHRQFKVNIFPGVPSREEGGVVAALEQQREFYFREGEKMEEGYCIFCSSHCPECGSCAIEVSLKAEWTYQNHQRDMIHIEYQGSGIEVRCICGYEGSFNIEDTWFPEDVRLLQLSTAMNDAIGLKAESHVFEARHEPEEKGRTEITEYTLTSG